jgi:hypothetical protein
MSDVKRFNFNARDADGSIPLYVRAADFDALQAENTALRAVLREYVEKHPAIREYMRIRRADTDDHPSVALEDRARALLAEDK